MRFINKFIAVALPCVVLAGAASATPVLDIDSAPPSGVGFISFTGGPDVEWQQQVTEDATGKLSGIVLYGTGTGDVKLTAGTGFSSGPWSVTLDDVSLSDTGTSIDLSSYGFNVAAGSDFLFDLSGFDNYDGTFLGGASTLLWQNQDGNVTPFSGQQGLNFALGFQTFVDQATTAVPEPRSLALLCVGLAGIAFLRRREAR